MTTTERELEVLAAVVHGALAALHLLSAVYNWRLGKKNRLDFAVHACAFGYDAAAVWRHAKRARGHLSG